MTEPDLPTSWSLLDGAAAGNSSARSQFAERYEQPIRRYLQHRWRGQPALRNLEDAVQDAFVECFKPSGVLQRVDADRGEFRALLYGVVRNVARRHEERVARSFHRAADEDQDVHMVAADAEGLSRMFDRAWAQAILAQAAGAHEAAARTAGPDAVRRQQVLRMRHDDGLPVRDIAQRLGIDDVASVHNEYRRGRREFAAHLKAALGAHTGATGDELDAQLGRLSDLFRS